MKLVTKWSKFRKKMAKILRKGSKFRKTGQNIEKMAKIFFTRNYILNIKKNKYLNFFFCAGQSDHKTGDQRLAVHHLHGDVHARRIGRPS